MNDIRVQAPGNEAMELSIQGALAPVHFDLGDQQQFLITFLDFCQHRTDRIFDDPRACTSPFHNAEV